MKFTKKCSNTYKTKQGKNKLDRRRSSAGMFYTSSAGAVTSLIFLITSILISILIFNNNTYATTSTLTISVIDSVPLDITSISTSGTFATSDTSTNNISVTTNNGTGYELGIKASSEGSNALSATGGGTIPSHTITAGVSESNYKNDTYASTNNLNNTWGYRPSKLNSVANSNYLPGPTSASTITTLDKTSTANPSTANTYNLSIGARVNNSTAPGAYSNTFIVTVVANPALYSITYDKNTTDTVTNMPDNVTNQETSSETVTLSNNTPTRNGYSFQGWCTTAVADGADCTSTSYSAGGNWTIDQTAPSNSLSLYARWKATKIYIQDLTLANCSTTPMEVYDKRDEKTYKIAKLADNNCWMLDNLALDPTIISLDDLKGNTDASDTTLGYLKNGGGSSPYTASAISKGMGSYEIPKVATEGTCYNGFCVDDPTSGYWTNASITPVVINGTTSLAQGKIGIYYNFCAASAGSYCYSSSKSTGNASESLCPAGWRMPTGNTSGEYESLYTAYSNDYANFQIALSTPLSGFYNEGAARNQGSEGYFWSSTRCNRNDRMCYLNVSSDNVVATSGFNRSRCYSIRCILSS